MLSLSVHFIALIELFICFSLSLLLQGIVYLVLTDKGYPKRLAFLYLDELHDEFLKVVETLNPGYI